MSDLVGIICLIIYCT